MLCIAFLRSLHLHHGCSPDACWLLELLRLLIPVSDVTARLTASKLTADSWHCCSCNHVVVCCVTQVIHIESHLKEPAVNRPDLAALLRGVQEQERQKLKLTLSW